MKKHNLFFTFQYLLVCVPVWVSAQQLSLEEAVNTALKNNLGIKAAESQVDYFKEIKKAGTDIGKLSATWMHGQYNSFNHDNNVTVLQTIPFPTVLANQVRLGKEQVTGAQQNLVVQQNNLVYDVKLSYYQMLYQKALKELLLSQDSLFTDFAKASALRYKTGESNLLEKTTAETQLMDLRNMLRQNEADILIQATQLQALLKSDIPVFASDLFKKRILPAEVDSARLGNNPALKFMQQEVAISHQYKRTERSKIMPDIMVGGFAQSLTGWQLDVFRNDTFYPRNKIFTGWELGLGIPLWIKPSIARARAAGFQEEAAKKNAQHYEVMLTGSYMQALRELDKSNANITYYETSAMQNALLLLTQARKAFRGGEIGYIEYLQAVKNSIDLRKNYLLALHQYNQVVIKIEFLLGKY